MEPTTNTATGAVAVNNGEIVFTPITSARICIKCGLPISYDFYEFPIVDNRKNMNVIATFFAHPSNEACADEKACRMPDADPRDFGVIRAKMLDQFLTTLREARAEQALSKERHKEHPGPSAEQHAANGQKRRGRKPAYANA